MSADERAAPPRVRRAIADRVHDNLTHAFPLVPLDRTGDERLGDLLKQLRDERDRRANQKGHQHP